MLIKVYIETPIHSKIIKIPDEYDFYIYKLPEDFTKEEQLKANNFYNMLYEILDISEEIPIEIDFESSAFGVEKKIDTVIKDWLCYDNNDKEWKDFFEAHTVDDIFEQVNFDSDDLWDLIQWLRKFCD